MPHLNLKIDRGLDEMIRRAAKSAGVPISTLVRDALRRGLGQGLAPKQAGWIEGRAAGYAAARLAFQKALADLPAKPPK